GGGGGGRGGAIETKKKDAKPARGRSFLTLMRAFWSYLAGHRHIVGLALGTLTLSTVIGLIIPASTKIAIDYIITDAPGPSGLPAWVHEWAGGDVPAVHGEGTKSEGLVHGGASGTKDQQVITGQRPVQRDEAESAERKRLLWVLAAGMAGLVLLNVAVATWGRWQMTRLTKRIAAQMRREAFEHAVRLPLNRLGSFKTGGVVSILREDAGAASELLFSIIYNPWRAIVQLVGTLLVLAWVDWRMLVGGIAVIPATWLTHRTWINKIRPIYKDIKITRQGIDASSTEAFGGMRVVRGFGRYRGESTRFTFAHHLAIRKEILVWWWSRILEIIWAVLIPGSSVAVLVYGGSRVIDGTLTIGDVMMFTTYLLMLLSPMEMLTNTASTVQSNLASFDRVQDMLAEPLEFAGQRGTIEVSRSAARGEISMRDVSFRYPASGKPQLAGSEGEGGGAAAQETPHEYVLRDISLSVRAGETVALVGPSGSGKTTLCNLVARFYDPTGGEIRFDGMPLKDVDVESYRRLLGIVEQDVFLFDGTVAENIGYGRRNATLEQIREAARIANAAEFIEQLEQKYDTLIGERGVRLSGGQKQRIAIARAVLADPVILILDEATSNLDSESEALIQESLARLMKGRTCFVIAHRLSTIRHADRIVVLEEGRIVEMGTHAELMKLSGRYAQLLKVQLYGSPRAGKEDLGDGELAQES
ncbi:MAG TPA: ABC transporter ATP-binding protein, partial [Phycisphaerales bacterium]|nr:ABC transporter ATP-binding protein [Phycisphaerales bacterium]